MDIHKFLEDNQIDEKVTFIGHSLGAKAAMSFALLYPERVHALCSIDSVPLDRNPFPEMNNPTSQMIKSGLKYLAEIEKRSYHDAFKFLQGQLSNGNKIFISALMIQLDRRHKGETT